MSGGRPFAFAGLWECWSRDGEAVESFAIVTTQANELLAKYHDRMPAIVHPNDYDLWLRGDAASTTCGTRGRTWCNRPPAPAPAPRRLGGMTAETFAVVRLPRPRVARLISCHADRAAADWTYQFADPPAVLVRLGGDGFTVLAGKGAEAGLGADPRFWAAVLTAVRARRPRLPSSGLPPPGVKRRKRDRR
jgi:SOS response associated peptidase (SRAP)